MLGRKTSWPTTELDVLPDVWDLKSGYPVPAAKLVEFKKPTTTSSSKARRLKKKREKNKTKKKEKMLLDAAPFYNDVLVYSDPHMVEDANFVIPRLPTRAEVVKTATQKVFDFCLELERKSSNTALWRFGKNRLFEKHLIPEIFKFVPFPLPPAPPPKRTYNIAYHKEYDFWQTEEGKAQFQRSIQALSVQMRLAHEQELQANGGQLLPCACGRCHANLPPPPPS
jgi:hypothetical protein